MEWKEFAADSRESAVAQAIQHYGVSEGELRVSQVPEDLDISGLGGRVLVLAGLANQQPRQSRDEDHGGREGRDRGRDRDRGERRDRSRSDRKPREERPVAAKAPVPEPEPEEDLGPQQEVGAVGDFVRGILEKMSLGPQSRVEETRDGEEIKILIRGASIAQMVKNDQRTLLALSHLAHRAGQKLEEEEVRVRVSVAHSGVSDDRGQEAMPEGSEELEKEARAAAADVQESGEALTMRPMNSKERWVIHNVIREIAGVTSRSDGEGRTKRVKVEPE